MDVHKLSPKDGLKTIAIGIAVAIATATIMSGGLKAGISPLPKPLALAFAETLLGNELPLPVGLLFHLAWVTFFSAVYVVLFRNRLTFVRAFWLASGLWIVTLVIFFPIVGWGLLGLSVTPKLIVASAVPHLLFAFFLWALCKASFSPQPQTAEARL